MIPFRVLFVCIGNVCRSPVGERLLRARLPSEGYDVQSAGLHALVGSRISGRAAGELTRLGGDPAGFRARQLDTQMLLESDLNLVATLDLRSELLAEWPGVLRRTFTVREFAALLDVVADPDPVRLVEQAQAHRSEVRHIDYDIPDPYRRTDEDHRLAATLMHEAVERIAQGLGGR